MRRMILSVMLAVLFVSLFGVAVTAFANDGDNFAAAGKKVLQDWEQVLFNKEEAIRTFTLEIAADGVIAGKEMIILNSKVDDFYDTKHEGDEYLKFYNLKTVTVLDESLVEMTKYYYNQNFIFKRDLSNSVKTYFTRLTGRDIVVLRSDPSIAGGEIAIMIIMFIFLVMTIFGILLLIKDRDVGKGMFIIGVVFIIFFAVVLAYG